MGLLDEVASEFDARPADATTTTGFLDDVAAEFLDGPPGLLSRAASAVSTLFTPSPPGSPGPGIAPIPSQTAPEPSGLELSASRRVEPAATDLALPTPTVPGVPSQGEVRATPPGAAGPGIAAPDVIEGAPIPGRVRQTPGRERSLFAAGAPPLPGMAPEPAPLPAPPTTGIDERLAAVPPIPSQARADLEAATAQDALRRAQPLPSLPVEAGRGLARGIARGLGTVGTGLKYAAEVPGLAAEAVTQIGRAQTAASPFTMPSRVIPPEEQAASAATAERQAQAKQAVQAIGELVTDFWEGKAQEIPRAVQGRIWDDPSLALNPHWLTASVAETVPSFAAAMLAGAGGAQASVAIGSRVFTLTPAMLTALARVGAVVSSSVVAGGQEGAGAFEAVLRDGGSSADAAKAATFYWLASMGLNAISFSRLYGPGTAGLAGRAKNVALAGGTEAVTEYLEAPTERGIRALVLNKPLMRELVEGLKEGLDVLPAAGLLGAGAKAMRVGGDTGRVRPPEREPVVDTVPDPLATLTPEARAQLTDALLRHTTAQVRPAPVPFTELAQQWISVADLQQQVADALVAEQAKARDLSRREAAVEPPQPYEGGEPPTVEGEERLPPQDTPTGPLRSATDLVTERTGGAPGANRAEREAAAFPTVPERLVQGPAPVPETIEPAAPTGPLRSASDVAAERAGIAAVPPAQITLEQRPSEAAPIPPSAPAERAAPVTWLGWQEAAPGREPLPLWNLTEPVGNRPVGDTVGARFLAEQGFAIPEPPTPAPAPRAAALPVDAPPAESLSDEAIRRDLRDNVTDNTVDTNDPDQVYAYIRGIGGVSASDFEGIPFFLRNRKGMALDEIADEIARAQKRDARQVEQELARTMQRYVSLRAARRGREAGLDERRAAVDQEAEQEIVIRAEAGRLDEETDQRLSDDDLLARVAEATGADVKDVRRAVDFSTRPLPLSESVFKFFETAATTPEGSTARERLHDLEAFVAELIDANGSIAEARAMTADEPDSATAVTAGRGALRPTRLTKADQLALLDMAQRQEDADALARGGAPRAADSADVPGLLPGGAGRAGEAAAGPRGDEDSAAEGRGSAGRPGAEPSQRVPEGAAPAELAPEAPEPPAPSPPPRPRPVNPQREPLSPEQYREAFDRLRPTAPRMGSTDVVVVDVAERTPPRLADEVARDPVIERVARALDDAVTLIRDRLAQFLPEFADVHLVALDLNVDNTGVTLPVTAREPWALTLNPWASVQVTEARAQAGLVNPLRIRPLSVRDMVRTIQHELAHRFERNHDADFTDLERQIRRRTRREFRLAVRALTATLTEDSDAGFSHLARTASGLPIGGVGGRPRGDARRAADGRGDRPGPDDAPSARRRGDPERAGPTPDPRDEPRGRVPLGEPPAGAAPVSGRGAEVSGGQAGDARGDQRPARESPGPADDPAQQADRVLPGEGAARPEVAEEGRPASPVVSPAEQGRTAVLLAQSGIGARVRIGDTVWAKVSEQGRRFAGGFRADVWQEDGGGRRLEGLAILEEAARAGWRVEKLESPTGEFTPLFRRTPESPELAAVTRVREALAPRLPESAYPQQIRSALRVGGVSDNDVAASGLTDWLAGQRGRLDREAVLAFLDGRANQPEFRRTPKRGRPADPAGAPPVERTALGDQALVPGTPAREQPSIPLRPTTEQRPVEDTPLFGQEAEARRRRDDAAQLPMFRRADAVDSPAFREWFGASKVVDEQGQPKVIYHGTGQPSWEALDPTRLDPNALYGPGFYMTEDPEIAGGRVGQRENVTTFPTKEQAERARGRKGFVWRDDTSGAWNAVIVEPTFERRGYAHKGRGETLPMADRERIATRLYQSRDWARAMGPGYLSEGEKNIVRRDVGTFLENGNPRSLEMMREQPYNIHAIGEILDEERGIGGVYPLYARIERPFDIDGTFTASEAQQIAPGGAWFDGNQVSWDRYAEWRAVVTDQDPITGEDIYGGLMNEAADQPLTAQVVWHPKRYARERLEAAGFDGITHTGGVRSGSQAHRVWIAFEPEQIKSAIGNVGTFRRDTADIRFRRTPRPETPADFTLQSRGYAKNVTPRMAEDFAAELRGQGMDVEIRPSPAGAALRQVWARPAGSVPTPAGPEAEGQPPPRRRIDAMAGSLQAVQAEITNAPIGARVEAGERSWLRTSDPVRPWMDEGGTPTATARVLAEVAELRRTREVEVPPPPPSAPPPTPPAASTGGLPPVPPDSPLGRLHDMANQPPTGRSIPERLRRAKNDLITAQVNKFHPVGVALREAGAPDDLVRIVMAALELTKNKVAGGTQNVAQALGDIYREAGQALGKATGPEALNDYLWLRQFAKRIRDLAARPDSGVTPEGHRVDAGQERLGEGVGGSRYVNPREFDMARIAAGLAQLRDRLGADGFARVDGLAQRVWALNRDILDRAHDAGIVSRAAYESITARGQDYVPMQVLDFLVHDSAGPRGAAPMSVRYQSYLRTMEGTERDVRPALEASLDKAGKTLSLIERNIAARTALAVAREIGIATEIPGDTFTVPGDRGVVEVFENGERHNYAVPPEIEATLKFLSQTQLGWMHRVLQAAGTPLRAGATGANLGFMVTNFPRDVAATLKFFKAGWSPLDAVRGIMSAYRQDEAYRAALDSGALFSTFQKSLTPEASIRRAAGLRAEPGWGVLKTPSDILRWATEHVMRATNLVEEGTKMAGVLRLARQPEPVRPDVAARFPFLDVEALRRAYEVANYAGSPNFARAGTLTAEMNVLMIFYNARLQGTARTVRRVAQDPVTVGGKVLAFRMLAYTVLPTLLLWALNRGYDDDLGMADVAPYDKSRYHILLLPWTYQAADGARRRVYLKLAMDETDQAATPLLRAALDWLNGSSKETAGQLAMDLLGNLSPVTFHAGEDPSVQDIPTAVASGALAGSNPLIRLPVEIGFNYAAYRQSRIIPRALQERVLPEDQARATTSPVAVGIMRALAKHGVHISPIKLEYAVSSATGGLGQTALDVVDRLAGKTPAATAGSYETAARYPILSRILGTSGGAVDRASEDRVYTVLDRLERTRGSLSLESEREFGPQKRGKKKPPATSERAEELRAPMAQADLDALAKEVRTVRDFLGEVHKKQAFLVHHAPWPLEARQDALASVAADRTEVLRSFRDLEQVTQQFTQPMPKSWRRLPVKAGARP